MWRCNTTNILKQSNEKKKESCENDETDDKKEMNVSLVDNFAQNFEIYKINIRQSEKTQCDWRLESALLMEDEKKKGTLR